MENEPPTFFRLELPDGDIETTDRTPQAERQQILANLRARHPELLASDDRLERVILGDQGAVDDLVEHADRTESVDGQALELRFPDGDVLVTDQTTEAERREILSDLERRYPDILTENPQLEGMIMEHGNLAPTTSGDAVPETSAVVSGLAPPGLPLVSPVQEQKSLFSRLFRR